MILKTVEVNTYYGTHDYNRNLKIPDDLHFHLGMGSQKNQRNDSLENILYTARVVLLGDDRESRRAREDFQPFGR